MSRPVRVAFVLFLSAATARAADETPAIGRGIQYLRGRAGTSQVGETALVALAMIKAEVPAGDPSLVAAVQRIRSRVNGSVYSPERSNGADIYEAAVVCLALVNIDPVGFKNDINAAAQYIIGLQKSNGSWDYPQRTAGDASISQYAVLGLWEAENAGVEVPPRVWDKAASWYISVQSTQGSWNYHRDEVNLNYPETVSMTAAGVGSLLICQRQLARYRKASEGANPLLVPLTGEAQRANYDVSISAGKVSQAIQRGMSWLGSHFTTSAPTVGQSPYYGLYGIERIGALADKDTLGGVDWFEQGRKFIVGSQKGDGSWNAQHGDVPNTVWAVLFLTKSTAKSIRKIQVNRLKASNLLGGRGLPKDLSSLTIAQGRVVVRPMYGAVEGMLDVLAVPRSENADSALAGLIDRYHKQGPKVLRPHKDRFRKLLADRDPGVRRVAAWALGRTADLDVVPDLIGALRDPDETVMGEARTGLQVISRKLDGYGPPPSPSDAQRRDAIQKWRQWYATIRPPDLAGPSDDIDLPAAAPAPAAAKDADTRSQR